MHKTLAAIAAAVALSIPLMPIHAPDDPGHEAPVSPHVIDWD